MYTKSNVRDLLTVLIDDVEAETPTQGPNYYRTFTNCDRSFDDGFPHQIHPQITTLRIAFSKRGRRRGSWMVIFSQIGNPQGRFCGSMGSVRSCMHF